MAEVVTSSDALASARERFSALQTGFVFLDAPGGTQVPDEVGDAIARRSAPPAGNLGARYATGRAVEAILAAGEGQRGPLPRLHAREIAFGMNMTTLNFAISRAAGRDFAPGGEILTTDARPRRRRRALGRARRRPRSRAARRRGDRRVHDRLRRPRAQALGPHPSRRLRARLERHRQHRRRAPDLRARP